MRLDRLISNLKKISVFKIIADLLKTEEYEEFITALNKRRLAKKGEYVDGDKITTFQSDFPNVYALETIEIKSKKSGLAGVTDYVTLFNTGTFYASFALKVKRTFFSIVASKTRLRQLERNVNINFLLGLTEQDKIIVSRKLVPDVIKKFRKKIFAGLS